MDRRQACGQSSLNMQKKTSLAPAASSVAIIEPGPSDVLCGRGGLVNHWKGNQKYRRFVEQQRIHYARLPSRSPERIVMADLVIKNVRNEGGRFLQYDSSVKGYVEVSQEKAFAKTAQALREGQSQTKKNLELERKRKKARICKANSQPEPLTESDTETEPVTDGSIKYDGADVVSTDRNSIESQTMDLDAFATLAANQTIFDPVPSAPAQQKSQLQIQHQIESLLHLRKRCSTSSAFTPSEMATMHKQNLVHQWLSSIVPLHFDDARSYVHHLVADGFDTEHMLVVRPIRGVLHVHGCFFFMQCKGIHSQLPFPLSLLYFCT